MTGALVVAILVLAVLGMPLFIIFGGSAMALFAELPNTGVTGAAHDVFSEKFADSPLMVTIPLFTVAGYIMAESGTPRRLVELSRAWLGWMPGGLAIVCLMASAFFTTFTGGSGITIVAIGGLLYPALIADRYPEKFSLGLITSGGSLGLLFPPSLPLVLYGVVAGVLIEKLFLAGLIPGLVTMLALGTYAVVVGVREKMPRTPFDRDLAFKALWHAKWEVILPIVLLAGLFTGFMRIHEAAAFTAFYALVIEVWVYKDLHFTRDLPRVIREAVTMFGAILAILATAIGFTAYLIQAQVPMRILEAMESFISSPWMFLFVLNIFLLGVGMLMDIFSAIVVVVPLIVPIAQAFGVDPYHLGIVFLLNLEIGYMTPPVGLNLFISSFRFEKPVTLLYRAVLPFIALLIVALLITTYVSTLSTWLPGFTEDSAISASEIEDVQPHHKAGSDEDISMDDLMGGEGEDELNLDDLEAGDDLTLDDLEGGDEPTLDDLEDDLGLGGDEPTLDDLEAENPAPAAEGEAKAPKGDDEVTLDDLESEL